MALAAIVLSVACGASSPSPAGDAAARADGGAAAVASDARSNGDSASIPEAGSSATASSSASGASLEGGPTTDLGPPPTDGASDAVRSPEPGVSTSPLQVTRVRCDLRVRPLQVESTNPRLTWEVEALDPTVRGETQTAFEVLVASSADNLARDLGDLWASGTIASGASRTTYGGAPLASLTRAFYKVRIHDAEGRLSPWSDPAEWTQGLRSIADWGAQWIGAASGATVSTMPIFRREFAVAKPVERALVSVCGLGQYELRLNGQNVSDGVLEPGWTHFAKSCLYRTFDVTALVSQGANAMGVLLGNGMYNVVATPGRYTKFTGSFGAPRFIARVQLDFADGSRSDVVTDASWRTTPGPITFTSVFGGEDFDARAEPAGWDRGGYADASWAPAAVINGFAVPLIAQSEPPVHVAQDLPSIAVTQPKPGVFVYDLGQNFSGWPVLEVTGAAGAVVRMTPGEILNPQGLVTQSSMGGGPIYFQYTLGGGGASEEWHPRFSYTGLRYVQVDGAVPAGSAASFPTRPQVVSLSGAFVHTASNVAGEFSCSDPDVNKIHALVLAAFRSNLQSLLTDCPQREKLGWLETSHLLARAMMFNDDVQALYEQQVANIRDAQTASGLVPDIAPEYATFAGGFRDSPEWGSAYLLDAWSVYQMYGDARLLEQNYAGIKRYVDYLASKATQGFLAYGLGDWYDVGPQAPGPSQLTSNGVTATAVLFQDATTLTKVARLLGYAADAAQYTSLGAAAAAAYERHFWNAAGYFDRNSQTANAMPLALSIVTASHQPVALSALVQGLATANDRVTAGDIGFGYLVSALSDAGRGDLILAILKQRSGPGYLYQIDHGATSLTEAWDANPSSSQNHAMLGHAERWLWEGLAGLVIDEASPGFRRFDVRPQMPVGIDSASATFHSVQGVVASAWKRAGAGVTMTVSVPVNSTATIYVPTRNPSGVTESGVPVASAAGVKAIRPGPGVLAIDVGSGTYDFGASN